LAFGFGGLHFTKSSPIRMARARGASAPHIPVRAALADVLARSARGFFRKIFSKENK
jgi:hypothetical protein